MGFSPQTMTILVIGPNTWGKADTLSEAVKKAGNPKVYEAYIAHTDSFVDQMGYLCFPEGQQPKMFHEKKSRRRSR